MLVRQRELKNNYQLPFKWGISSQTTKKQRTEGEGEKKNTLELVHRESEDREKKKQSHNNSLKRTKLI